MSRKHLILPVFLLGAVVGGYIAYNVPLRPPTETGAVEKPSDEPLEAAFNTEDDIIPASKNPIQFDRQEVPSPETPIKKDTALLDAPIIEQLPEFRNGCEVVSLTMLLQYYGIDKNKMELAEEMKKDPTERKESADRIILYWGNPNTGFVGDITGKTKGYGIYNRPLLELLEKYIPSALNLTGRSFDEIERSISDGRPVVVWTTVSFEKPREDQWLTWDSPQGEVRATFQEHAVLLVGYDNDYVYVNDPLSGKKQLKLEKRTFLPSWEALGKQAISYSSAPVADRTR
ncbi:hypothetical protein FE782_22010 [Paenibacillus antri]|uniref:Peptidase C39-like domain-containing protein n=1 Tax=Paenibacillus antri TaxID=2582848 RepID=A0A5R9G6P5_9BACL|nr:C39 family peptidase [Paenibacillus antri]TLS50016.1 hypothetical protein FE782_22010 [Paenibacillus antri]